MSSTVIDASRHAFSKTDRVLVDANVWLYLFGPNPPNSGPVRTYSAVFASIQKSDASIYLDVLVLSEFINRLARVEHRVQVSAGAMISSDFKTFRDSPAFLPIAQAIQASTLMIGRYAQPIDHLLTACDLPAVLAEFAKSARDINDELLADACRKHNLALLTNDADLYHAGITILTTNPRMLRRP